MKYILNVYVEDENNLEVVAAQCFCGVDVCLYEHCTMH